MNTNRAEILARIDELHDRAEFLSDTARHLPPDSERAHQYRLEATRLVAQAARLREQIGE